MKGKLFILFVMVGIPTITWAILAWAVMIVLGGAARAVQRNPSPFFLGQPDRYDYGFYRNHIRCVHGDNECVASAPPRRPLTPTPEETARRQKSCLAVSLLRWAVSSPTPAGAARGTRTFCLSRLGGHFPFHGYFADKTKSR